MEKRERTGQKGGRDYTGVSNAIDRNNDTRIINAHNKNKQRFLS